MPKKIKALPAPTAARMNQYLEKAQGLIQKHGWLVQTVLTSPPLSYTVGLTRTHGLPEIAVAGLAPELATEILNTVATDLVARKYVLAEAKNFSEVFGGANARFQPVPPAVAGELRIAALFAPRDEQGAPKPVVAWQLLWPDPTGLFPGEPGVLELHANMQNLALVLSERGDQDAH